MTQQTTPQAPQQVTHWIDGKPWSGVAARSGDVFNPATGVVTGRVDFATTDDVDDAVAAAIRRAGELAEHFGK